MEGLIPRGPIEGVVGLVVLVLGAQREAELVDSLRVPRARVLGRKPLDRRLSDASRPRHRVPSCWRGYRASYCSGNRPDHA